MAAGTRLRHTVGTMGASEWARRGWRSLRQDDPALFLRRLARFLSRLRAYLLGRLAPVLPRPLRPRDAAFGPEYRFVSDPLFRVAPVDLADSARAVSGPMPDPPRTATWFVPAFRHVAYAGLLTVFRFIDRMGQHGLDSRVVVYDEPLFNTDAARSAVAAHFPALAELEISVLDPQSRPVEALPGSDLAFCTWWTSAYVLARYNRTRRKYYFVQDFEPSFYEAGSRYALAESTYRFGFRGIFNSPGLQAAIGPRYGMNGISFVPAVDARWYFPPVDDVSPGTDRDRLRIFFYCRPQGRRNAFELGLLAIEELLRRHGPRIEVITAGEEWDEADYGLAGRITNLGLLPTPQAVGELYRSCDIGLVYMLSKHPSYQPLEFMACGMAVVANRNEDNAWLLRDGENCLVSEPGPAAMAEAVGRLVDDAALRSDLRRRGRATVTADWDGQIDAVWTALLRDDFGGPSDRPR